MPAVYLAVFFSVSAFIFSVFSFFFLKSYLKRRTDKESIISELREGVDSLVLSLDEKTERDISLIEEREKTLRSLLEEVDKRFKLYTRELEKRREDEATLAALTPKPQAPSYLELGKNRYRLTAQPPAPEEKDSAWEPRIVEAAPASGLPIGEQIRELSRAGFSPPVIASRLGLSITEVEFITTLMERREQ